MHVQRLAVTAALLAYATGAQAFTAPSLLSPAARQRRSAMCPSTGLRMVPFKKESPVQPCNDILSEDDCADGKLHCRPTLSKKQPTPIDAAALIQDVFTNLKKRDPYQ